MPYYKFELLGGERGERYRYAMEFGLRPSDHTGHHIVFYKEHPATLAQLRKNHCSDANDFKVVITEITKDEFEYR